MFILTLLSLFLQNRTLYNFVTAIGCTQDVCPYLRPLPTPNVSGSVSVDAFNGSHWLILHYPDQTSAPYPISSIDLASTLTLPLPLTPCSDQAKVKFSLTVAVFSLIFFSLLLLLSLGMNRPLILGYFFLHFNAVVHWPHIILLW